MKGILIAALFALSVILIANVAAKWLGNGNEDCPWGSVAAAGIARCR